VTGRITTRLSIPSLSQEGSPIIAQKDHGIALQIDDTSGVLKIFVPRRKKDREVCFYSKLPQHLFAWMMSYPKAPLPADGVRVVQAVLTASSYAVAAILEEAGIPPVSIPCEEEEEEEEEAESDEEEIVYNDEGEAGEVIASKPQRDGLSITQPYTSSRAELISHKGPDNTVENDSEDETPIPSVAADSPASESDDFEDAVLSLENVHL
jgi:hypothetical protein